jgi:hypothetical protein
MSVTQVWAAEITKAERDEAGDLIVYGKATGPDLDLDQQIADSAWLKQAMPEWMAWGNLREMHQPVAAGIGLELDGIGDDWWLKSKVVDEGTARKIEAGALKGYSIGIKNAKVVRDALAPGGRITGGSIVEVSYVDRPCNPTAKTMIVKSLSGAGPGDLRPVEAPEADADPAPAPAPAESAPAEPVDSAPAEPSGIREYDKAVGRDVLRRVHKLAPSLLAKAALAEDIASAQDCIAAIGRLIAEEAQGLAAGNPGEAYQIRTLLDAVCALEFFCEMESYEPTPDTDTAGSITMDAEDDMAMAADADLVKTVEPAESAMQPVAPAALDRSTVAEMISKAVAEASRPAEERVKALEAELAKVHGRPIPGGPVLARPVRSIVAAEGRQQTLAKADRYDAMAADLGSIDKETAQGYRNLAADLRSKVA